jgi:hypothetical protein
MTAAAGLRRSMGSVNSNFIVDVAQLRHDPAASRAIHVAGAFKLSCRLLQRCDCGMHHLLSVQFVLPVGPAFFANLIR